MLIRLLGPVEVIADDGQAVPIGGPQRRVVLASLAMECNRVVSVERLLDQVWNDEPPPTARTALQARVSELRRLLDSSARLTTRGPGYLLEIDPARVDVHRFRALADVGPAVPDDEAEIRLRDALALWRGAAFEDVPSDELRRTAGTQLRREWLRALAGRADRLLALGCAGEIVPDLTAALTESPLDESLAGTLVRALGATGRPTEAAAVFERVRQHLSEELGVDPGPALLAAHESLTRAGGTASPVRAAGRTVPAQLPPGPDTFVGRRSELAWLDRSAEPGQFVMITGTGGVGKTALARYWLNRVVARYPDGQLYADMRGFDEVEPVPAATVLVSFLRALGVPDARIPGTLDDRVALYRTMVAGKRMLVVLDNARLPDQVRHLLPGGPATTVVVTSRHRLPGLVTQDGATELHLEPLGGDDATALLRAIVGERRVAVEPDAARALVDLCDHLPLVVRVAAARLKTRPDLTIGDLVAQLSDERKRLAELATDDAETSVAAMLDLTYRTLSDQAAAVFRLLGTHPGGTVDAYAAAALAEMDGRTVRRALSLLQVTCLVDETGSGRYARHDLVRIYGGAVAADELTDAQRRAALSRLLDYYLAVTGAAYLTSAIIPMRPHPPMHTEPRHVPSFADSEQALTWFTADEPNMRSALERGLRAGFAEQVWRIVDQSTLLYVRSGSVIDQVFSAEIGMRAAHDVGGDRARLAMLRRSGEAYMEAGRTAEALPRLGNAVTLARAIGSPDERHKVLIEYASCADLVGETELVDRAFEEALALLTEVGPRAGTLSDYATALLRRGDVARALEFSGEAMVLLDADAAAGSHPAALDMFVRHTHGSVLQAAGNPEAALVYLRDALAAATRAGSARRRAQFLRSVGLCLAELGRPAEAVPCLRSAVVLYDQLALLEIEDVRSELSRLEAAAGTAP